MSNISMLRHRFSNERWVATLNHLHLLFCKSVYLIYTKVSRGVYNPFSGLIRLSTTLCCETFVHLHLSFCKSVYLICTKVSRGVYNPFSGLIRLSTTLCCETFVACESLPKKHPEKTGIKGQTWYILFNLFRRQGKFMSHHRELISNQWLSSYFYSPRCSKNELSSCFYSSRFIF